MRRVAVVAIKAVLFIPCCAYWLWWTYSMRASVDGGFYKLNEAHRLVVDLAILTTCLVGVVWIVSPYLHRSEKWTGLSIKTFFETLLILAIYTSAVLIWRNNWTPAKGISDEAAFMPVVGHVNAAFFSEFLWLEYVVAVIPAMSLLSAILTCSLDFLQRPRQIRVSREPKSQELGA